MTTIAIDRNLLEQALAALSAPNHCVFSEPPICVDIRAALAAPATAPDFDEALSRVLFERHWRKTRGQSKAERELKRHPLQPQTYVQDSANRHWTTWQTAVKSKAPATAPEPVAWMSPKRFYRTRAMALINGEQLIEPLYLYPPATAPEPSWQDAPTCAGLWFCDEGDENPYRFTCHNVSIPLKPHLVGEGERWYGPIPPDGDKP